MPTTRGSRTSVTRRSRFLFVAALAVALVGAMLLPGTASAKGGKPPKDHKVDICHNEGNGSYHLINISERAVAKHIANHGDGFPGEPVPGDDASDLDQDCNVVPAPTSCQEWRAADPNNGDGDYEIFSGQRFTVYCHDMAGTPVEYLTLVNTYPTAVANFSQATAGGSWQGTDVRTYYTKVRLDPVTLRVAIDDQTFSTSTGSQNGGNATSMPYGVAADCRLPSFSAFGIGNVDLTGTPFKVIDPFTPGAGFQGAGTVTKSASDQVVDLTGGGRCGFTTPEVSPGDTAGYRSPRNAGGEKNPGNDPNSPFYMNPPYFILDLAFLS